MRQGRNFQAIATLNGKIFVMGGIALGLQALRALNSVEVYDVKTNQWMAGKPLVTRLNSSYALYLEVVNCYLCLKQCCSCSEAAAVWRSWSSGWREDLRGEGHWTNIL